MNLQIESDSRATARLDPLDPDFCARRFRPFMALIFAGTDSANGAELLVLPRFFSALAAGPPQLKLDSLRPWYEA